MGLVCDCTLSLAFFPLLFSSVEGLVVVIVLRHRVLLFPYFYFAVCPYLAFVFLIAKTRPREGGVQRISLNQETTLSVRMEGVFLRN
jgi:hypothetical protein